MKNSSVGQDVIPEPTNTEAVQTFSRVSTATLRVGNAPSHERDVSPNRLTCGRLRYLFEERPADHTISLCSIRAAHARMRTRRAG